MAYIPVVLGVPGSSKYAGSGVEPDLFVPSYFTGKSLSIYPAYYAKNVNGNMIADVTTLAGLNNTASDRPLSYYTSASMSLSSKVFTDSLVVPYPNYLNEAAAAGVKYGTLMKVASETEAMGQSSAGMFLAAPRSAVTKTPAGLTAARACTTGLMASKRVGTGTEGHEGLGEQVWPLLVKQPNI